MMRVWVDQDLCTGDGLCTDHCPDVFMMLEDGLSYVRDSTGSPCNDPGGVASSVSVPSRFEDQTIAAALDCPGECIFLEAVRPADGDHSTSEGSATATVRSSSVTEQFTRPTPLGDDRRSPDLRRSSQESEFRLRRLRASRR